MLRHVSFTHEILAYCHNVLKPFWSRLGEADHDDQGGGSWVITDVILI